MASYTVLCRILGGVGSFISPDKVPVKVIHPSILMDVYTHKHEHTRLKLTCLLLG